MRRNFVSLALAMMLCSCAALQEFASDPRVAAAIEIAQNAAKTFCAVIPIAADLARVFQANPELIDQGQALGKMFCDALPQTRGRALSGTEVSVKMFGQTVRGTRI